MRIDSSGNVLVGATSQTGASEKFLSATSSNTAITAQNTNASNTSDVVLIMASRNTSNNTFRALTYYNDGASAYRFMVVDSGAISTAGSIQIGDAGLPPTSGIGIKFPATQSASSDANTLDDYEEGTWTPTLPNGGTLTVESARYVKIGQQVTVSFYVSSVAPTNNGSDFRIGGLPYANGGYSSFYLGGSFGYVGDSNLSGWLPITGTNVTYIYFHIQGATAFRTNAQYLTAASGSTDALIMTITYFTAT